MPVFSRNFGFEFVTRVWDIFIFEDMKIIYRVCLALLKCIEKELLSANFESSMEIIRNLPQSADIDLVLEVAWAIPLTRDSIQSFNEAFVVQQQKTSSPSSKSKTK